MHAAIAFALLVVLLVAAAVTDVRSGKVYNWLTYPAMLIGLALAAALGAAGHPPIDVTGGAVDGLIASVVAVLAGLIGLGLIAAAGGIGFGDVKLLGAYGAIAASWKVVVSAAMYSFVIAALIAVVVMFRYGLVKRTFARLFGAAMLMASKVSPDMTDDSPRIPFAVALALGGILAAGELLLGWNTPWAGWQ